MAITENVYKTHDNQNIITVSSSASVTPLAGIDRVTVELSDAVVVDSDVLPSAIAWTDTQITLSLGDVASTSLRSAIITVYSVTFPGGQVIAHPDGNLGARVYFNFIEN